MLRRVFPLPDVEQRPRQNPHHILQKSVSVKIKAEILLLLDNLDPVHRPDRRFFHVRIRAERLKIMGSLKDFRRRPHLLNGGCPVHASVTAEELIEAKKLHPNALVLVHPECIPAVTEKADYAGSTSGIMDFAKKSDHKEFIIGTEISIVEHLQFECPDKKFYPLSKKIVCNNMKLTTIMDVYNSLLGIDNGDACEIIMSDEQIEKSRRCIDEMIRLGG